MYVCTIYKILQRHLDSIVFILKECPTSIHNIWTSDCGPVCVCCKYDSANLSSFSHQQPAAAAGLKSATSHNVAESFVISIQQISPGNFNNLCFAIFFSKNKFWNYLTGILTL